jgi:hypothetical protein
MNNRLNRHLLEIDLRNLSREAVSALIALLRKEAIATTKQEKKAKRAGNLDSARSLPPLCRSVPPSPPTSNLNR